MSCDSSDTHHRTYPRYSPKECSRKISVRFEKHFSSYRAEKAWSYWRTNGWKNAGNANTPSALELMGKNELWSGGNQSPIMASSSNASFCKKKKDQMWRIHCLQKLAFDLGCDTIFLSRLPPYHVDVLIMFLTRIKIKVNMADTCDYAIASNIVPCDKYPASLMDRHRIPNVLAC